MNAPVERRRLGRRRRSAPAPAQASPDRPTLYDSGGTPFDPPAWRKPHRRLKRFAVAFVAIVVLAAGGVALYVRSWYGGLERVAIVHATSIPTTPAPGRASIAGTTGPASGAGTTSEPTAPAAVEAPGSTNVLLTGSDNRTCIDPKSPYAGAFLGDGADIGARSDTILVLHLDAASKQLALLSFPRDLWVRVDGGHDRINATFDPKDPSKLVQTIEANFGIRIDHYVGVDFCAFKDLVDAVGGLAVPFEVPTRDRHTGLSVDGAGCHAMNGDEALAYVRAGYYEQKLNGKWVMDTSSDYGRMARQQDFLRRLASKAISVGVTNPLTAKRLLDAARHSNVRIDDGLGLTDMVRLAKAVKDLGPSTAASYRVDGHGEVIRGGAVIVPDLTTPASQAILAVFRGQAPSTSTGPTNPPTTAGATAAPRPSTAAATSTSVAPDATSNMTGVVPPADQSCS